MSDNNQEEVASRLQQSIAAGIILALGLWVAFVSFNVEDSRPYLFPQLISVVMVLLATYSFVRALRGGNRTGIGVSGDQLARIAPALAIMLLYVFVLAETLGYYLAATLSFLAIYSLYDPEPHLKLRTWIVRLTVTAGFMTVIYLVFAVGLRVQTPRGLYL